MSTLQTLDRGIQALFVVAARSLPTHWPSILPGLRSRLSQGLAVPIALPGPITRRMIVEQLAVGRELTIDLRSLQFLADSLAASVPELDAALAELDLQSRAGTGSVDFQDVRQFVVRRG